MVISNEERQFADGCCTDFGSNSLRFCHCSGPMTVTWGVSLSRRGRSGKWNLISKYYQPFREVSQTCLCHYQVLLASQEKLRNQFLTFFVMRATTQYRPPFWYALKNKEEHKMMYGDSIRSKYCKCTALYFVVLPCNLRWRLFSFFFLFISKLKEVEIVGCPAGKHTRLSFKALIGFLCCVST